MSNQIEEWLDRCESFAIDVLEKHGEPTTWPGYAQVENDEEKPDKVRQAAGILFWVLGCREDIEKHGPGVLDVIYRAVHLSQQAQAADIRMGRVFRAGQKKGTARANEGEGAEMYPKHKAYYDTLLAKGFKKTESEKMTAVRHNVSTRTVRRAKGEK